MALWLHDAHALEIVCTDAVHTVAIRSTLFSQTGYLFACRCLVKSVGTAGKDKKGNPVDAGVCVNSQLGKYIERRQNLQLELHGLRLS